MRVDDFVCLGRTVPEDSKKYGRKVCCAGYSEELRSFLRIYPLPVQNPIRQRTICQLEIERPSHDSRSESWRLKREREDAGVAEAYTLLEKERVVQWLDRNLSRSISCLNSSRLSLGVLKPSEFKGYFKNAANAKPDEAFLFGDIAELFPEATKFTPYVSFRDADGHHNLQLREWGCYEWMRKQPGNIGQLWDNLGFTDANYEHYFVVGNMCNHRNVWLIISTFRVKKEKLLFDGIAEQVDRLDSPMWLEDAVETVLHEGNGP